MTTDAELDLVRLAYRLVAQGDFEAFIECLADTVEIHYFGSPHRVPWSGVYHGRAGAARHFSLIAHHLDIREFVPHEFIRAEDRIVVPGHARGQGRETGTPFDVHWLHIWTVSDDRIVAYSVYNDTSALAAAIQGRERLSRIQRAAIAPPMRPSTSHARTGGDMFTRIDHVALHVGDLDRSIDFYETNFGFRTYFQHETPGGVAIAYLRLGDTILELAAVADGTMRGFHFCLETDDFEAAFDALSGGGVEVIQAPHETPARAPRESGWRRTVFGGPDGEHIEIRG